jgi:hypothetical protein
MRVCLVLTLLAGLLGMAGCQQPEIKGPINANGLAEVANSGMNAVLVDPKVDFSRYRAIAIADMNFARLQIVEPSDYSGRHQKMKLSEEDMAMLRSEYRRKLGEVLSEQGGYQVVDSVVPGAKDTLILRTDMVRLEPNAPREKDEIGVGSARDKTFTKGAGSMTMEAELVDIGTGKAVVVLVDEVADMDSWSNNNPVSNRAAILRGFTSFGYGIRRQLDAFSTSRQ